MLGAFDLCFNLNPLLHRSEVIKKKHLKEKVFFISILKGLEQNFDMAYESKKKVSQKIRVQSP